LVAPSVGTGIGRLVAMAVAIGTVVASTPAPTVALPATPTGAFMPRTESSVEYTAPTQTRSAADRVIENPRWKVERADSLWLIAESALGDGERAGEILEHNRWLDSPRHVKPGQILTLPADAIVPADRQPSAESAPGPGVTSPESPSVGGFLPDEAVVITPGDTLWDLAEQRLAAVDDDVTGGETLRYVNEVVAANPHVVEDPNLIFPGEVFTFPAVGTPPAPPPEPAAQEPVETVEDPPTPTAEPQPAPANASPTPAPAVTQRTNAAVTETTSTSTPATTASRVTTVAPATASAPAVNATESSTMVPWLAGISGATALASGVLLAYRRRLALRAARGAAAYRTATAHPAVLTAVTRASDVSLLRWANDALIDLTTRLAPTDIDGQPLAVELSETAGIELLWTHPNQTAPEPWRAVGDGWTWRLGYDPDQPVDNTDRPAAIPALVTIGRRDDNQLLLNLEAVGTLAVDGDDAPAADFVRSLVAELAVGELLTDTFVLTTGVELDTIDTSSRVRQVSRDEADWTLAKVVDISRAFLQEHKFETAFAARLSGDAVGRETTVVVVDDEYATPLIDGVVPGLAAALIYTGAPAEGPCVRIADDGSAVLEPYGIDFEPAALPVDTTMAVAALLDEPAQTVPPPDEDETTIPTVAPPDVADDLDADLGEADDWEFPEPAVLVRVLGAPEVLGHTVGRLETSIVTYLACHGGCRRDEQVINAVWNGRAVEPKTLWNRVSKIRSALGHDLVPNRNPNSPKVVMSDRVMTDLAVLASVHRRAEHVSEAEALPLLLQGLELIDGVPFDSAEYEWAFETQDHAAACETIEAATLRCVDIAMNLGDLVAARHAVTQGLRALPLNEPLYRARMRIEAASGNPDGVRQALSELTTGLGGTDGEPQIETVRLARELAPA
ncbi:MAG: LysM peptidoglycan-binding domain-containing protein, partial [Acidimicrobiia bacterium]